MYYVYLLRCNDGSFYTGVTNNLDRRFIEHRTKSGGWHTKIHKAAKILYTENFPTKIEALKREKQIKGWRREKKLNLIRSCARLALSSPKGSSDREAPKNRQIGDFLIE